MVQLIAAARRIGNTFILLDGNRRWNALAPMGLSILSGLLLRAAAQASRVIIEFHITLFLR
jgi:hypothetical protein